MNPLIRIITCLLIVGCSSQTEQKSQSKLKSEKDSLPKFFDLSKRHVGFWVYEEYYKALQETKSTKKAGEMGGDDFYRIYEDNSIMRMNIHDGGAENIILMTSENKGQIFSSDTTESYFEIEFRDGILLTDNKKYIKAPDNKSGFNELVNSSFISGKYMLDNNVVELKTDGTVIGLDSILSYELNLDYNDAGMQYDKIYLQFKDEKESRTYLYALDSDTLTISEVDCKTLEDNFCVEIERGESIYKLIKK